MYSTQPQGCDPEARTAECILHSSAARRELIAYAGYPTPLPHAPGGTGAAQACPPYRIVNIPRKGLGMVAAHNLAFGEVITNECPLLVAPQYILLDFIRWLGAPSGWENQQVALFEMQRFHRMASERMRGDDKVAYLQLYNASMTRFWQPCFLSVITVKGGESAGRGKQVVSNVAHRS